jgi:hypothetical protein
VSKEFEEYIAELQKKYQALPEAKKQALKEHTHKRNFLRYKKIELIKSELLRMEARRAQLELCDRGVELKELEKRIILKKEKLLKCLNS